LRRGSGGFGSYRSGSLATRSLISGLRLVGICRTSHIDRLALVGWNICDPTFHAARAEDRDAAQGNG